MTKRRAVWLAIALYVIAEASIVGHTAFTVRFRSVLSALGGDLAPNVIALVGGIVMITALATVGALIVARHPTNVVGWILLGVSLHFAIGNATASYAVYALQVASTPLPGGTIAAWWADIGNTPSAFFPFIFLFLFFPNGRLLSRRWRPLVWLALLTMVLWTVSVAIAPGALRTFPFVENPFGVEPARGFFAPLVLPLLIGTVGSAIAGAFALILRFRRSLGDERQQLKWLASASVFVAVVFASGPVIWSSVETTLANWLWPLLFSTAITTLPVAVGMAIFKHRLYDIDVIINRTLVYGALTLTLALVYVGTVVALQGIVRVFSGDVQSQLGTVVSTLTIAALFQPVRQRIQALIDRRFYRRKYDAQKTLQAFNKRLRDEVELHTLTDDVLTVVEHTLQPVHVSLWLRPATQNRRREGS